MKKKTKIILQIRDNTAACENNNIDNTLEHLYNVFEVLLVTQTYYQDSIRRFLIEKGEELNEIYYKNETED